MEKHSTNAHIHLLLRCDDRLEQVLRSLFLLQMLDNVPRKRPTKWDDRWQREAWKVLIQLGGWSDDLLWGREDSVLTDLAPAGTAMVQFVNRPSDLRAVTGYMTKCWKESAHTLATRRELLAYEEAFDFKELREFHAPADEFARLDRIDPVTGSRVLDLDKPLRWKHRGRIVH